jgi:hypothetical protein
LNPVVDQETKLTECAPANSWKQEPTLKEAVLIWALVAVIFVATVSSLRPYMPLVRGYGDAGSYMQIAHAIRTWDFSGLQVKHFWGLPYAMALLSKLTGMPEEASILAVCAASSLTTLVVAYRLWGGWIAVFISILNFYWVQLSFLGGSEPFFMALLLGSLIAIRKERWYLATLLASFATITRPLGMCLLLGIGVYLLWRRDWRRLAGAVGIGGAIGILYVLPLKLYLHDPLATVHSYGVLQASSSPGVFGIPFRAIIVGTLLYPSPWTNLVITFGWILLVLAGNIAMVSTKEFRAYAREHVAEAVFVGLYLFFLYSYNAPRLARGNFPRFAIPILPFVFLALLRWLPKDRRLLWCAAVIAAPLAAFSAIGIQNIGRP